MKKVVFTLAFIMTLLISDAQNVGIGTAAPAYKLDVAGRMRLQNAGANTSGLWLDGPTTATRSFIGTMNEDYVGLYGNGGSGWSLVMNVNNGNTGIGVLAPTAKLDVNGDIRIRGSFPKLGSVLTSTDANGNAHWADPVAFRAVGGFNGQANTLNNETWTKILFHQTPNYNLGLNYQALLSQFLVAENGVYHFDAALHWDEWLYQSNIRIMINRGGNIFTAAENLKNVAFDEDNQWVSSKQPSVITVDVALFAGDVIWIEGYADIPTISGTTTTINASGAQTWFSGHLVARY